MVSGEVTIADPVTASTARAVIDAASFSSGHRQRDKDVKSANPGTLQYELLGEPSAELKAMLAGGPVRRFTPFLSM